MPILLNECSRLIAAVGRSFSRLLLRPAYVLAVGVLGISPVSGQAPAEGVQSYAQLIAEVYDDLGTDEASDAQQRLEATAASHRGFEFDYLMAVAGKASDGEPANLIQKVENPNVPTRYGVLNELTRQLVFICRDGSLRIRDLSLPESGEESVVHAEGAAVWRGVFSYDGTRFFSSHGNGDVLVWDSGSWELLHTISMGRDSPVRELAAAPDGQAFVAESKEALVLWSLAGEEPKEVAEVGPRLNFGEGLAYSPRGDLIATGGMFDIQLYDAKSGKELDSLHHASYTMGLEFSHDGERIASAPRGNVNKFLAVFDIADRKRLFNAGPFEKYIIGMAFSPDGKRIAATGCEKVLRLFDAASGEVVFSIPRPACGNQPAFTRDGQLLGWSEPDGYYFIDLKR